MHAHGLPRYLAGISLDEKLDANRLGELGWRREHRPEFRQRLVYTQRSGVIELLEDDNLSATLILTLHAALQL